MFHGLGVADRMGEAVVSGNRFRDHHSRLRTAFEKLLGAFMSVEVAQLEMQNRVADNAETKMSGLNDACVNRTDRDFRDALALNFKKRYSRFDQGTLSTGSTMGYTSSGQLS